MPGSIPVSSTTPAKLAGSASRRLLVLRNKAAADSGVRVWFAWQSDFTADNAAYLEPGETLVLHGHQSDVGRALYFLTSSSTSTIYWS